MSINLRMTKLLDAIVDSIDIPKSYYEKGCGTTQVAGTLAVSARVCTLGISA